MNQWEWQLLEDKSPVDCVEVAGVQLKTGDRVRLRPRLGGDVLDIALAGKIATIEAIEQDYEGQFHFSVVVDEDPGRDMGVARQPGHRFFFGPTEVEPIEAGEGMSGLAAVATPSILIAGIGNIFLGDDAFGVEVAQRLAQHEWPAGVRVVDFGIRGFDLVYALLDGCDVTILVDACPRGDHPGTLYVIEPDLAAIDPTDAGTAAVEAHSLHPLNVLRLAKAMDGQLKRILLVGCEPQTLGGEEGAMGLSEPVAAAVDPAVSMIETLVTRIKTGHPPAESS